MQYTLELGCDNMYGLQGESGQESMKYSLECGYYTVVYQTAAIQIPANKTSAL